MLWMGALVVMLASDPQIAMRSEPGDAVRAELAVDLPGSREEQARALLGDVGVETGVFPYQGTTFAYAAEAVSAEQQRVVIFAPSDAPHTDRACVISPTGQRGNDNTQRALTWCKSFLRRGFALEIVPRTPQ